MGIAVGAILFTAAPVVGVAGAAYVQLKGANWLGCGTLFGDGSSHPDSKCEREERRHEREVERKMPWVIGSSVALGVGGLALGIWASCGSRGYGGTSADGTSRARASTSRAGVLRAWSCAFGFERPAHGSLV